jgi:molybdopterin converting factor small subunit
MPEVTVQYWAGARAAAGVDSERVEATDVATLVGEVTRRHGERLGDVIAAASLLVDGLVVHDRSAPLTPGATVEVLPPFAGG